MNRIQLKKGLHFWWQGQEYVIKQRLDTRTWEVVEVKTDKTSSFQEIALIELLFRGEVVFNSPLLANNDSKKN